MAKSLSTARNALRFRRASLRILRDGPGAHAPEGTREDPAAVVDRTLVSVEHGPGDDPALDAWKLFLGVERCALALARELCGSRSGAAGGASVLPGEFREALTRRARFEQQRALSARAHLRRLDELLESEGTRAVVLKGGAAIAAGDEPLDLADVDLYLEPEAGLSLTRRLDAEGARPRHGGVDDSLDGLLHQHFAPRGFEDAIAVEVHHTLEAFPGSEDLWSRARPVDAGSRLHVLSVPDHLWHVLWHSVVHHPFRRGKIRDLLLTARALKACTPGERGEVQERIAASEFSTALSAQIQMAEQLRGSSSDHGGVGSPPRIHDPFRREAAANYLLVSLYGQVGWPVHVRDDVTAATFALIGGAADRRTLGRRLLGRPVGKSAAGWLRRMENRFPRLGRELRRLFRIPRACLSVILAAPVAAGVLWLTRRDPAE